MAHHPKEESTRYICERRIISFSYFMAPPDVPILSCAAVGHAVAVVLSAVDVESLFCSGYRSTTIKVPSATGVFFWRPCCLLASLLLLAPAVAGVHTVGNILFVNGISIDFWASPLLYKN
jgi:hypothetical protein